MSYPNFPIVGVKGVARSGKDTIAAMLAEHLNGALVAQADPMKRFAMDIFEFDEDQLWGGERKELLDPRIDDLAYRNKIRQNFQDKAVTNLEDWDLIAVEDALTPIRTNEYVKLKEWFSNWLADGRNFSPRKVLQTLGTEFGRTVSKHVWSDYALGVANALLEGGYHYGRVEGLLEDSSVCPPAWVFITDIRFRSEALAVKAEGGWLLEVQNPELQGKVQAVTVGIQGHASETEVATIPKTWNNITFSNDKRLGLEAARTKVALMAKTVFTP